MFQPSYFSHFQPFQILQTFIFLPFQHLHTFSFMFSWTNCSAIKLFTFLSSFSPITFQPHCLNIHTLFHTSGRKSPNYKRKNFLNGRCCMNKPRQQHAPMTAWSRVWTAGARSSLLVVLISISICIFPFCEMFWRPPTKQYSDVSPCSYDRKLCNVTGEKTSNSSMNMKDQHRESSFTIPPPHDIIHVAYMEARKNLSPSSIQTCCL